MVTERGVLLKEAGWLFYQLWLFMTLKTPGGVVEVGGVLDC